MRRHLVFALALLCAVAAPAAAAGAVQPFAYCPLASDLTAAGCPPRDNLQLDLDWQVAPRKLPTREMAPVALEIEGQVSTKDGTQPPALREAIFDFDKNGAIEAAGLPICARRQIEDEVTGLARSTCRDAIVGGGTANLQVGQVEAPSAPVSARLTLFNGGVRGGVTRLFIHATLALPEPISVVAPVQMKQIEKGRYGWTSTVKLPRLFDGLGSLVSFELRIGRRFEVEGAQRSYLTARCIDGRLAAKMIRAVFHDEASNRSTTLLNGTFLKPCTSQERM